MSLHLANISMEEGGRRGINFLTRRINFNVNAESFHLIGTSRRETIKSGESFPLPLLRRVINEAMNRRTMPVTRRSASEYRIGSIVVGEGEEGGRTRPLFREQTRYISERENAKFNRVNDNVYSAYVRWIFPRLFVESGNIERDKHDNLSTKWRQFNEAAHPSPTPSNTGL